MGYSNFWARKCSCEDFERKEEDDKEEEEDDEAEEVDEKETRKLYHNLYSAPSAI